MGNSQGGALNSAGFSSSVQNGFLPNSDHITYPGVGQKPKELIELYFGYASSHLPIPLYAKKEGQGDKNDHFLGLFTKSIKDGQPRDTTPLHAVIVLDISGSMGGPIQYSKDFQQQTPRLELAKSAIKHLLDKMRPTDALALVVFDTKADTILPLTEVAKINRKQFIPNLEGIVTRGGTAISCGFSEAIKNFDMDTPTQDHYVERRMIMLTDVGDNSIEGAQDFVSKLKESQIHTTIIGISQDFQSSTCEALINVQGFNYFCALEDKDLQKFLVDNFDYTFFPFAYDIEIIVESPDIDRIEVYGTNDSKNFENYQTTSLKKQNKIIITKSKSTFPSAIEITDDNQVNMEGGLILCKIYPKQDKKNIQVKAYIKYRDTQNKDYSHVYELNQYLEDDDFYSDDSFKQAISSFYYVQQIKQILDQYNGQRNEKLDPDQKQDFINRFKELKKIMPKSSEDNLNGIIAILQKN